MKIEKKKKTLRCMLARLSVKSPGYLRANDRHSKGSGVQLAGGVQRWKTCEAILSRRDGVLGVRVAVP